MRYCCGLLLLAIIGFSGCDRDDPKTNPNQSNANSNTVARLPTIPPPLSPAGRAEAGFKPCNEFFPLVPGSVAKYVLHYSSGLIADVTVVVDASGEENGRKFYTQRSQIIDRSGGMEIVQQTTRKFACDGDRVLIINEVNETNVAGSQSGSEFQYRDNSPIMIDPASLARKGSTWQIGFQSILRSAGKPDTKSDSPTIMVFESGDNEAVQTPVGTFNAKIIVRKVGENVVYDYFAPGIGLVKRQSKEGTYWELREFSGLKAAE